MNQSKSSTRIGNAERGAAQSALSEHLNAGRLQVNEYAERSARAADAMTAADIAALFTDLPAPRPSLPGTGTSKMLRSPAVIGAAVLALVALALVVGFGVSQDPAPVPVPPPPRPVPTNTTPPPIARPTTSIPTTAAPDGLGGTVAPLPGGVGVRRTTGSGAITLRPSFGVDLDNQTSENWAVANTGTSYGRDVAPSSDGDPVYFVGDYAVVTGAPEYTTCAGETAYTRGGLELGSIQPGDNICIRTDEKRYAVLTVVAASEQAFQFRAVVWDPPVS
jgi:hypothetical protein